MKKRVMLWLAAGGGILLALALRARTPAPPAAARSAGPPVLVGQVRRQITPLVLDAIGAAEPTRTATLRSQVTGTLLKVHFQEGQLVHQRDLLFEIDARPFENALATATAGREKIHVQLENAQRQLARYRALSLHATVSDEQLQSVEENARVLAADLAAAESAVANAQLQVEYCAIRAPLTGRTGNLGAHEGDLVRAADPAAALVTINQLSPIYVSFSLPQQELAALQRAQAAGTVAVSTTPPGAAEPEPGEVAFIDNTVDASTGTLRIKAIFANPRERLWPGQFAAISLTLEAPESLVVPAAAVQNDQKGQHVFVLKDGRTAEFRAITVARTSNDDVVVATGLAEGDAVIVDGQLRVIPGKEVDVRSAAPTSEARRPKARP